MPGHSSPVAPYRATMAATLILVASVVCSMGCSPAGQPAPRYTSAVPTAAPTSVRPPVAGAAVAELLRDSWVTDADGGYFVDGAWSGTASPFSLYETYWQVRWRNGVPTDVDPGRMRAWIAAGSVGRLRSSGMQAVAQIGYAVELGHRLGLPADREGVARALEQLRSGTLYGPDVAAPGDWGSTLVVLRAQTTLSLPLPPGIIDAVDGAIDDLPATLDLANVVTVALPLLGVLTLHGRTDPRLAERATKIARAADTVLRSIPPSAADATWLGAVAELRQVQSSLGMPTAPVDPRYCGSLVRADGAVALPGSRDADTQATYTARQVGCRTTNAAPPRPHTRAGWVRAADTDPRRSLATTAHAMRLAHALHLDTPFASAVAAQIQRRWLPLVEAADTADAGRLVMRLRMLDLARSAGATTAVPPPSGTELQSASAPLLVRLLAAEYVNQAQLPLLVPTVGSLPPPATDGTASIESAAMLKLAGVITGDHDLLRRAQTIVARFRLGQGVFAAEACTGTAGSCVRPASVAASAIGSWVDQSAVAPHDTWSARGICHGYACPNGPDDDGLSMRAMAIAAACTRSGCGDRFPIPI